ncbi:MAG TPA: hypothetical protein DC049_14595 [Spirochaetia bacterium]|nr:hypothetical protein [Spirochaetia bacterium]
MKYSAVLIFSLMLWGAENVLIITNFSEYLYSLRNGETGTSYLATALNIPVKEHPSDWLAGFNSAEETAGLGVIPRLGEGYFGKAAEFLSRDNTLRFHDLPDAFFGEHGDIGSFSIEFYFFLYQMMNNQVILNRHGSVHSRVQDRILEQGFSVYIQNNRLCVSFDNFFHFKEKMKTVILERGESLICGKWYHAAITFDALSGLLIKHLDGREEDCCYVSENGLETGTLYYPAFLPENKLPLTAGENFNGKIDEIQIKTYKTSGEKREKITGDDTVYTSRVFQLKKYSMFSAAEISEKMHGRSFSRIFTRSAGDFFLPDNEKIPWREIKSGDLETDPPARYYQFRLMFNNDGQQRNFITKISINYDIDIPPLSPVFHSIDTGPGSIDISWKKNTEADIAGYRIYYAREKFKHPLQIIEISPEKTGWKISGLENGRLYYFALAAYDYAGKDNESEWSEIKFAVPGSLKYISE